jgi:hypothetical protein
LVGERAQKPSASITEDVGNLLETEGDFWKLRKIETSGPIDADENGPQRAAHASSIGFEREGASCEDIELMQTSPVRATIRRL